MKILTSVLVLLMAYTQAFSCDCIAEVSGNMNGNTIHLIDADDDVILYTFTEKGEYDITLPPTNDVYVQFSGGNGARLTIDCGGPVIYDSGALVNPQPGTVGDDVLNCASLPVEWGRITAEVDENRVYFQIETLSETNASHFEIIWYSHNEREYKLLTTIQADNQIDGSKYFYMSKFPPSQYYFKVREVGFDGSVNDSHWVHFEVYDTKEYIAINMIDGTVEIYNSMDSIPKRDTTGMPIPWVINGKKMFLLD